MLPAVQRPAGVLRQEKGQAVEGQNQPEYAGDAAHHVAKARAEAGADDSLGALTPGSANRQGHAQGKGQQRGQGCDAQREGHAVQQNAQIDRLDQKRPVGCVHGIFPWLNCYAWGPALKRPLVPAGPQPL